MDLTTICIDVLKLIHTVVPESSQEMGRVLRADVTERLSLF